MKKSFNFQEFLKTNELNDINKIVSYHSNKLEGNCIYQDQKLSKNWRIHTKKDKECVRFNLFSLCQNANNILEVGFNAGHSSYLYLYSNPKISITTFDICVHKYTKHVLKYLQNLNKYDIRLIEGDSTITLKEYEDKQKFDLIHIDGGHKLEVAESDIQNCLRFSHEKTLLIIDDSDNGDIKFLIDKYIKKIFIKEINYDELNLKKNNSHRIFKYCM